MKVYSGNTYIGYIVKDGSGYLPHIDYGDELSGLGRFNNKTGNYALSKTVEEASQKVFKRFKSIRARLKQPPVGKLTVR